VPGADRVHPGLRPPSFNLQWLRDHCVPVEDLPRWLRLRPGEDPYRDFLKWKSRTMEEVQRMNQKAKEARAKGGDR
jgi:hypothetical protein